MTKLSVENVNPGEEFSYAGRWYARAQEAEITSHPANGKQGATLAYSLGDNKSRVPVSFAAGCEVFVKTK